VAPTRQLGCCFDVKSSPPPASLREGLAVKRSLDRGSRLFVACPLAVLAGAAEVLQVLVGRREGGGGNLELVLEVVFHQRDPAGE
jgi:hypothetical protein